MLKLSKNIIDEFVKYPNQNSFNNSFAQISMAIENAMKTIMDRNPRINKYNLVIANEAFSGSVISSSSLDLFLILDAPQIELNFKEKDSNVFVKSTKVFFKTLRENLRFFKKKKKSLKKIKKEEVKLLKIENYNILNFFKDFQIQLSKQLYTTTVISISSNCIKIVGHDEFGIEINIYPVFRDAQNSIRIYNTRNKKESIVDFKNRYQNFDNKNFRTKNIYKLIVRIFNNIYYNTYKIVPNQIYIESLLYNVPDEYFSLNFYNSILLIVNFLKNCDMQNFVSICDQDKLLFNETLNNVSPEISYKFIKSLKF